MVCPGKLPFTVLSNQTSWGRLSGSRRRSACKVCTLSLKIHLQICFYSKTNLSIDSSYKPKNFEWPFMLSALFLEQFNAIQWRFGDSLRQSRSATWTLIRVRNRGHSKSSLAQVLSFQVQQDLSGSVHEFKRFSDRGWLFFRELLFRVAALNQKQEYSKNMLKKRDR